MTRFLNRKLLTALASASLMAVASTAQAAIFITSGSGGPNPDENVLFNTGGQTGTTITGHTNSTNLLVNFTGLEQIHADGGQADITAVDGGFKYLEWSMDDTDTGYSDLKINILANLDGEVTLTFYDQFGNDYSDVFDISKSGQNFFQAHVDQGSLIMFATLSTTQDINHVQQVRLGVFETVSEIPEPAAWMTMIAGFGMVGFALRRNGKQVRQVLA